MTKESTEYDNFLGKKEKSVVKKKSVLPIFTEDEPTDTKEKLWVGMPEFVQEENSPYKTIYLHFRCKEDFDEFRKKYESVDVEQTISDKTKSMWYPHLAKDENSLKRWFEE